MNLPHNAVSLNKALAIVLDYDQGKLLVWQDIVNREPIPGYGIPDWMENWVQTLEFTSEKGFLEWYREHWDMDFYEEVEERISDAVIWFFHDIGDVS